MWLHAWNHDIIYRISFWDKCNTNGQFHPVIAKMKRLASDKVLMFLLNIQSTPVNSYPDNSDLRLIRTHLRSLFRDNQVISSG